MTQGGSTVEMGPTIGQIKASNETAIIVNTIGASTDSISSMKKCAKELMKTDALKDSHYYILEPDSCRINGETKTPEECELEINSMAHITMIYNRDEIRKGHFFNSGKYEMTISGEADIFDDCEAYYLFDN